MFHCIKKYFKRGCIQDYFDRVSVYLTTNQAGDNYYIHMYKLNLFIVNAAYDIPVSYVRAGDARHQKPGLNADDRGVRRMTSVIYCRNSLQAEG